MKKLSQFGTPFKSCFPLLLYGLLSIAILGRLLYGGHIFILDSPLLFSPDPVNRFFGLDQGPMVTSGGIPADILYHVLSGILSSQLIEKVLLLLMFFLAGLGAHRLVGFKGLGAYFAGVLYMINPFSYTRFLVGQWGVLWAYALTPFAIKAFIELLQQPDLKKSIKVAVLSTLVGVVQIQGYFLLFMAFTVILIVHLITERKGQPDSLRKCRYVGISTGLFCALNLYWLVPILTAKNTLVNQIGQSDLLFFAPKPDSTFGVSFDVASMYGFWRGGYTYAKDVLPCWWVLFIFILFLAIYGLVSRVRGTKQTWVALSFGAIGIVGFLMALGVSSDFTKPIFNWLWEHFSFFRGFRDSQKFVALLCLSYACLGGLGLNEFSKALKPQNRALQRNGTTALLIIAILIPLVYCFTMFGFYGQLGVTDYPKEWNEVNNHLNGDKSDFNLLFLPWHQYMDYSWLPNDDKRLSNPAHQFFDKPVIAGDNMESGGIYSQSTNPISKYVEFLLDKKAQIDNLGELLAPLNVKYVILVHESDYSLYSFLYQQTDLTVDMERPGITVFKNEHPIARAYAVEDVVHIISLEEYLELSKKQDVTQHLYVLENNIDDESDSTSTSDTPMTDSELLAQCKGIQRLELARNSPVKYKVKSTDHKYIVFTVPQNVNTDYWEYKGQKPVVQNLGFMPAFKSAPAGGDIVYTRFCRVYLPCYVVSAIALGVMLWLCCFRRSK